MNDVDQAIAVEQALAAKVTCRRCGKLLDVEHDKGARQRLVACHVRIDKETMKLVTGHVWAPPF